MIICAIDLKANNAIASIIDFTNNQENYIEIKNKKITLNDDESINDITNFSNKIKNLITQYNIDKIAIKKRAKKGTFAGGAVTFKLETIIQLNGICDVDLISSQSISSYEKKNIIEYPKTLNKYQEQSYLTALTYFNKL